MGNQTLGRQHISGPISAPTRRLLLDRRDTIVAGWYEIVTQSAFVSVDVTALHAQICAASDRLLSLLVADLFASREGQAIGSDLAELGYTRSETLGRSLDLLARELLFDVPMPDRDAVQVRAVALLGEVATGFIERKRTIALAEQEGLYRALLDARTDAEQALHASEERYRAVVTQAAEGIMLVDPESMRILETNEAFQHLLGYTESEVAALSLYDVVADDRAVIHDNVHHAMVHGGIVLYGRKFRRKDGSLVIVEGTSRTLVIEQGEVLCIILRDITERIRAEHELVEARRALSGSRDEERGRLARELHDGVVQELAGLRYQLASARRQLASDVSSTCSLRDIKAVENDMARMIGQLRDMIAELRPTGLDESGLAAALANFAGSLRAADGTDVVSIDVRPDVPDLVPTLQLCLFHVAREAMRNAIYHGRARSVLVQVRPRQSGILLRVVDDGAGFTVPKRLNDAAHVRHFGLLGMTERVGQAGGRLRILSRPGRGTIVTAWVPQGERDE